MKKPRIIRKAARIAKSLIAPEEKANLEKRVEFSRKQIHKRRKNNKRRNIAERNELIMDETGITDYQTAKSMLLKYGQVRAAVTAYFNSQKHEA